MDYGKRSYGSPANNHPTFIQEITDQYIQSIGGIWPADFKRPYVYSSYTEMQYLFNSPVVYTGGEAPLLEDLDVELDPLIPVPSDPYEPDITPAWPTPTPPPIPDDDEEEEDECICGGAHIGYTTTQMAAGESQNLTAIGDRRCLYTWIISSGDGAFSPYTSDTKHSIGINVTYTAPSSNDECAGNPIINLYCNGILVDSINIAVNAYTGTDYAYRTWSAVAYTYQSCNSPGLMPQTSCEIYQYVYRCDGSLVPGGYPSISVCKIWRFKQGSWGGPCPSNAACTAEAGSAACGIGTRSIDQVLALSHDMRTAGMITDGCCPYQLL